MSAWWKLSESENVTTCGELKPTRACGATAAGGWPGSQADSQPPAHQPPVTLGLAILGTAWRVKAWPPCSCLGIKKLSGGCKRDGKMTVLLFWKNNNQKTTHVSSESVAPHYYLWCGTGPSRAWDHFISLQTRKKDTPLFPLAEIHFQTAF